MWSFSRRNFNTVGSNTRSNVIAPTYCIKQDFSQLVTAILITAHTLVTHPPYTQPDFSFSPCVCEGDYSRGERALAITGQKGDSRADREGFEGLCHSQSEVLVWAQHSNGDTDTQIFDGADSMSTCVKTETSTVTSTSGEKVKVTKTIRRTMEDVRKRDELQCCLSCFGMFCFSA